ncbi:hypothetical protein D3C75_531630 [compost metagenome]
MHQHPRLGQGAGHQQIAGGVPGRQCGTVEGDAEMALQVPVGEQLQLATQQGVVVGRQLALHRQLLEGYQRLQRVLEQGVGVVRVDHLQIGLPAEIGQQQETLLEVAGEDLRHVHAGLGQQAGDLDERPAIFLRRRCVHHDQAAHSVLPAEIAAKAGVAARRGQLRRTGRTPTARGEDLRQTQVQPAHQFFESFIHRHFAGSPSDLAVA